MDKHFRIIILGTGLSALNCAYGLLAYIPAHEIALVERYHFDKGASNAPLGLLNPSTARKPGISPDTEALMQQAIKVYADIDAHSSFELLKNKGVFKPVPRGEDPVKWKRRFHQRHWPDRWAEWIEAEQVFEHTGFSPENAPNGGILIHHAWYLPMNRLREAFSAYLNDQGVSFFERPDAAWDVQDACLIAHMSPERLCYDQLIDAEGSRSLRHPLWQDLSWHLIKGQMAVVDHKDSNKLKFGITNSGYAAALSPTQLAVGSTYEHNFEYEGCDTKGAEIAQKKATHLLPFSIAPIQPEQLWSGLRVATKDRKPLIGSHPSYPNIYLCNGMGSKGLLHAPTAAQRLAKFIVDHRPETLGDWDLNRFLRA